MALMVVFWVAIVVGVVLLIRWLVQGTHASSPGGAVPGGGARALDIAAERYAKSEITKEQFDQIKRDLGG
jgi:putative membrane protein